MSAVLAVHLRVLLLTPYQCVHAGNPACMPSDNPTHGIPAPLLTERCLRVCCPSCSSGGVVLTSADGRIVCRNTLDHRVHIAYEANLPDIRAKLFGIAAAGAH